MNEKCKYPECHQTAAKTWALVPLCPLHFQGIYDETIRYYNGKVGMRITYAEREQYRKIAHLTTWGRKKK